MPNFQCLNHLSKATIFLIPLLIIDPAHSQTVASTQIRTIQEPWEVPRPLPQRLDPTIPYPNAPPLRENAPSNQQIIKVASFVFKGNTVIRTQELETVVASFLEREITFDDLRQVGKVITKFYVDKGYITCGAFLPIAENQRINPHGAVITIQVVEGQFDKIEIIGGARLHNYIRQRLPSAVEVVNEKHLLEALRLLRQDPLIESISAQLDNGSSVDRSILTIKVKERQSFTIETALDNSRSPATGSFQRLFEITNANLLGIGDKLSVGYRNTDGSNTVTTSYSVPLNPQNGIIEFGYINSSSNIIENPFNSLDILSNARAYELSFRQPIVRKATATSTQEFALKLTASRLESESSLLNTPYPLNAGANSNGITRISAVNFSQEWLERSTKRTFSLRSQFSFGIGAFGATINNFAPDGRFFAWRGQAGWLKQLSSDATFIAKADLQLADRPLSSLEQIASGGADSVRGYREATFLTDNAFLFSTELHLAAWTQNNQQLQIIPFLDFATAWNNALQAPNSVGTLASVGLGLQYQVGDRFNARLEWGIPLININTNSDKQTWQENGFLFFINYRLF
ncbi:ShlB/FhaC/HecB family hemolysin secretion/activation protein (plasmid) [Nostoc sp. C052]|uniref:ShlB/FhaC/HecB family hemolysin secretion/activation protein n=1 Tax=Nostoc sp. C052 TaxID=2576902 RepID=UPI0015C397B9|nr:ShlB/FhaC/HecB family hemolysin secretion/activation protein [Nostoc sp. C052]QLE45448.1 ShlB/FhaC/HecB family hemolysin secretion/activation protein [Nostoc sp. C052]